MSPASFKRIIGLCLCLATPLVAASSFSQQKQADAMIEQLYHDLTHKPTSNMLARLKLFSAALLNKPYLLSALGEGQAGEFDQNPLYRMDAFDCETYVDTVLALSFSESLASFNQFMSKIRYHNGHISYLNRNHFASMDWNPNNQKQGFLKDITLSITDVNHQPVAKVAEAFINKPAWYQFKNIDTIRAPHLTDKEKAKRLARLQKAGSQLEAAYAKIPYIPLNKLFNQEGLANQHLFAQIPDGSIIEIVRPNWNLHEKIGTNLNVSHLGFAFWKNDTLIFRQASSIKNKTIDVSLIDYLKDALKSPTIKGINIQIVLPKKPEKIID